MSSAAPAHRERVLRALGITPWMRRAAPMPVSAPVAEAPAGAIVAGECVVVLPTGCSPRELDLIGRALLTGGPALARAPRIEVRDGRLPATPEARAYLVFGEAQAHALGRELPAAMLSQAHIVLADEPSGVLATGAGKRRLWSALRSLRRVLGSTRE